MSDVIDDFVAKKGRLFVKDVSVEEITDKRLTDVISEVEEIEKRGEPLCVKDATDDASKLYLYRLKICFEVKEIEYVECRDGIYISDSEIAKFNLSLGGKKFDVRFSDFNFKGNGASVVHRVGAYPEKEKIILDTLREAEQLTDRSNLRYVQLVDFPQKDDAIVLGRKYIGLNIIQIDRNFDYDYERGRRDPDYGRLVVYHEYGHQYQFSHPELFEEYVNLLYKKEGEKLTFKSEFSGCVRNKKCYMRNLPVRDQNEDFADHFAQYRVNGCEFKRMDEPIMRARYEWIREKIYHGREFCE